MQLVSGHGLHAVGVPGVFEAPAVPESLEQQVARLEAEVERLEGINDAWEERFIKLGEFEDEMEVMAADRQALLARLGLTEHEWWCAGGEKFGDFARVLDGVLKSRVAVVAAVEAPVVVVSPEIPSSSLPPSIPPPIPPLPPGIPPIPPIASFSGEYRFFSNFWPAQISYEGVLYPSTEHAYQAAKTLDSAERARIAALPTAKEAKKAGRTVALRSDWEQVKLGVMEAILRCKFALPELAQKLRETRGRDLIEGNDWNDRFWGVYRGEGLNHLGRLLMKIRDELFVVPPLPPGVPPLPPGVPPLPPGVPPLPPGALAALPPLLPPPLPPEAFLPSVSTPPPLPERGMFASAEDSYSRPKFVWTPEQAQALDEVSAWRESDQALLSLTGPAGSGKTTILSEVCDRYPNATLAAMTGKAAQRVSQLTGRSATTLHKILYWPPKPGAETRFVSLRDPPSHLVICDESSMMSPSVFTDLQAWAADGVKILLVGDAFQLPPVISDKREREQYGEDYSVFTEVKGPALKTVMRNAGGVLQAATHVRERGEICAKSILDPDGGGYEFVREGNPAEHAVEEYLADRNDHFLVTWKNKTRMDANKRIRAALGLTGPLPDAGEPVLIKKNGQGYLNGEVVECGGFEDGPKFDSLVTLWMKVGRSGEFGKILVSVAGGKDGEFFDGGMPWVQNWRKYHIELQRSLLPEPLNITWAYCFTAHSIQGSQARRTTVFLESGDARNQHFRRLTTLPTGEQVTTAARWLYTAQTRSTHHVKMIVGR